VLSEKKDIRPRLALTAADGTSRQLQSADIMKRIFDIVCSVGGLLTLSPLLLLMAWRIKREDGGPVFYRGVRVGLHGKLLGMI